MQDAKGCNRRFICEPSVTLKKLTRISHATNTYKNKIWVIVKPLLYKNEYFELGLIRVDAISLFE